MSLRQKRLFSCFGEHTILDLSELVQAKNLWFKPMKHCLFLLKKCVVFTDEIGYERLLANPTKVEAISMETDATDAIMVARSGFVEKQKHKRAIIFMFVDEALKRPASMECVSNPTL
ncbi:hypothetical protein SASPL_115744 [Salvia splendens]|uniref:Uncharacterized protein n=1 Tax=Salvia splendens TaxID=180675 RepID=A0A8X8Y335_SALSN|nr:hypothetical protein SASPL_115744 [Salvia splendens]